MKLQRKLIHRVFVGVLLGVAIQNHHARAALGDFDYKGSLEGLAQEKEIRTGKNERETEVDFNGDVIAKLGITDDFSCNSSIRASSKNNITKDKDDSETTVDEFYGHWEIKNNLILTLGKERRIEGVGLFYNPTEFLNETKEADYARNEEERRLRQEGNPLVRAEVLFDKYILSAQVAGRDSKPESFYEGTVYSTRLYHSGDELDWAVTLYGGHDGFKTGLNLSGVVGLVEFHSEIAIEKENLRRYLAESDANDIVFVNPEDDDTTLSLTLGTSYLTKGATHLLAEYYYVGDGYSDSEWDQIYDALTMLKYNLFAIGDQAAITAYYDGQQLLTIRRLRRNYLAFRIQNQSLFGGRVDGALSLVINADDSSFSLSPSIEYKISDSFSLVGWAMFNRGKDRSEFDTFPVSDLGWLGLRYYF